MSELLMRSQKGFSLIEVLVAMALLGVLGVTVPSALSGAIGATNSMNRHTTAESIARSQMDYIQDQTYDDTNDPPVYDVISDVPDGYSFATPMAARLDPRGDGFDNDDGLQEITVTVQDGAKIAYTLIDYKVNFNP